MPSANTIGIESRIKITKTRATVASSIRKFRSVLGFTLGQRRNHHRKAVDGNQDATDDGRGVEPSQTDFEARCEQRTIEQAQFQAVPRGEQAHADNERVVETMDPELDGFR